MTAYLFAVDQVGTTYESDESLRLARVICTQLLMPIVCLVGVATNVLNIVVLTTSTMRSSTSCYLCAVAIFDLLYSLTGLPLTLRTYSCMEKSATYMHALKYLLSFGNMWSNTAAWLTCTFTVERFMAISTPIRSRQNVSIHRTQVSILIVCVVTAIMTLPDFFERKISEAPSTCNNNTPLLVSKSKAPDCNETFYAFESTWVGVQLQNIGWSYARTALFVFIPLIFLAIFNALLIKSVIKAHRARGCMLADPRIRDSDTNHLTNESTWRPKRTNSISGRSLKALLWRKWWLTRQFSQEHGFSEPINTASNSQVPVTSSDRIGDDASPSTVEAPAMAMCEPHSSIPSSPNVISAKRRHMFASLKGKCCAVAHNDCFPQRSSYQDKQSITITLIAVVVVFCVLTTPSAVVHLMPMWTTPSDVSIKTFGNVSNLLLMVNSALNFFLYSLFSARFRRSFRTLRRGR